MKCTPKSITDAVAKDGMCFKGSIAVLRHSCAQAACLQHSACGAVGGGGRSGQHRTMSAVCLSSTDWPPHCTACGPVKYSDSNQAFALCCKIASGVQFVQSNKRTFISESFSVLRYILSHIPSFSISFLCMLYIYLPYIVQAWIHLHVAIWMVIIAALLSFALRTRFCWHWIMSALWRRCRQEIVISWHAVPECCI